MFKKILDRFLSRPSEPTEAPPAEVPAAEPESPAKGLSIQDLRRIVPDAGELAKGTQIADSGGLTHLARYQERLFAEAAGSGASPYRVSIDLAQSPVRGQCSCMAARSRPICKHAAALLVTWSRAAESFAESDAPPAEAAGTGKKRAVKKGNRGADELMSDGVTQVQTLVQELAAAGVATVTAERITQVRELGAGLREYRLRRLSARCLALADLLETSHRGLDDEEYAATLGDLLLTASKVRKHLSGETMEGRYVEELIGKTWRAGDREPLDDAVLLEYAYLTNETADGFTIRESRFVDLTSGRHLSEKQIVPAMMVKRTPPKAEYAGKVVTGTAELYPGFEPRRVYLPESPATRASAPEDVERVPGHALAVARVLESFMEHRRDVFAPPSITVNVAVECIAALDGRLIAVDAAGDGLPLRVTAQLEEILSEELQESELRSVIGEVIAEGVLVRLHPLAAVVRRGSAFELIRLTYSGPELSGPSRSWMDEAKSAGLPGAVIVLGEVRRELAHALVSGLGGYSQRTAEPLAVRLRELRLEKIAALVEQIAADEAQGRVSSFVKADQLIGIALLRLAGTTKVDLAALSPVHGNESIGIRKPEQVLAPREVAASRASGRLSVYEAAWHYGQYYSGLGSAALAADLDLWADGTARPFLIRAFADEPQLGIDAARRVLRTESGRTAHTTAKLLLQKIGGETAKEAPRQEVEERVKQLLEAGDQESRSLAAERLGALGAFEAIPALRRAYFDDATSRVRRNAALALAMLGDVGMTETFARVLLTGSDDAAKTAAAALGILGDLRGLAALLESYVRGVRPQLIAEALNGFGVTAVEPILDLVIDHPALAKRQALQGVLSLVPATRLEPMIMRRIEHAHPEDDFAEQAKALLWIVELHKTVRMSIARQLLDSTADDKRKGVKTLRRIAEQVAKGEG